MEQGMKGGERLFAKIFWLWLSFAALATVLCSLEYFLIQQDLRQSANYPQSQIAEDIASSSAPLDIGFVDISTSLAPFISVFDMNGVLIQSNAILDGTIPVPPQGVFGYAGTHGEDRFTWQPQTGVRIAAVLVYHPGGVGGADSTSGFFVLSGRSLRDVETTESRLAGDTFFIWILLLVIMFVLSIFTAGVFGPSGRHKREPEPKIKPDEKRDSKPDNILDKKPALERSAIVSPSSPPPPPRPSPSPTPPLPQIRPQIQAMSARPPTPPPIKVAPPVPPKSPVVAPVPPPITTATPSIVLPASSSDMSPVYYSRSRQPVPPPSPLTPPVPRAAVAVSPTSPPTPSPVPPPPSTPPKNDPPPANLIK